LSADENLTSQFRAFQKRAIVFHSDPFARDTDVADQMRLTLSCAADAPDFDLWTQVTMVGADGSSVRLIIAPLNRPDFQKNFNSGGRLGYETLQDARVANIKIYHDAQHTSRLTLPVAAVDSAATGKP
jgi:predicted acyl esterase